MQAPSQHVLNLYPPPFALPPLQHWRPSCARAPEGPITGGTQGGVFKTSPWAAMLWRCSQLRVRAAGRSWGSGWSSVRSVVVGTCIWQGSSALWCALGVQSLLPVLRILALNNSRIEIVEFWLENLSHFSWLPPAARSLWINIPGFLRKMCGEEGWWWSNFQVGISLQ